MKELLNKKFSILQMFLTTFFVVILIISNIIANKQVQLPFGVTMPAAIILFPITYILSDLFSEVYGYKWSRLTNNLGLIMNLFVVMVFMIAISMPAPSHFELQTEFSKVLGTTPRILFASTMGLYIGDLLNDITFEMMKKKHINSHKRFKRRAIISSLIGQFGDSLVFIPIAFYGLMPFKVMLNTIIMQPIIKVAYEILILPITNSLVLKLSDYEKSLK
ncbi:MAG TPA: queuosine precursor transporter [Gallicola sp.]|nr:queuosine precursor transporter [Gallicola sp.]